ncbi:MAG TPA: translation elongation factor 4 [Candidatus Paceibacterota bacterium]|nr:translation elongation factor 4 [Candidatus Paceibacterota bacterium]
MEKIRNFVITAHIDHGKSTLADRMLEVTGTVPPHKMKAQYLDALDLERERGITIKMAPVRMSFEGCILNLIDTPGHSDFSYEVSRSLKAVEGAILLVDATQGIQAQTLANLESARKAELKFIGAVSKVDIASSEQTEQSVKDLADLLETSEEEIFKVSGKTGEGVRELLREVVRKFPDPKETEARAALVFSSLYDEHKGVLAFVRVFNGEFRTQTNARLIGARTEFKIKEVGFFKPELKAEDVISSGEIGYIATGIKDPGVVRVGDTIGEQALPGFQLPSPVVFVALYPDEGDDYENLKVAIYKLKLHDSSFSIIPTTSDALGRGFQCGFLGRLHFEIVTQRLEREFNIKVVNSFPSVAYKVKNDKGEWKTIENPKDFPDDYAAAMEPMVKITILSPITYLGSILKLKDVFRMSEIRTETRGERVILTADLPLSDLISDFDDRIKSVSSGFASFSYEFSDYRLAKVKRLDVTVAGDTVPGLSRVVSQDDVESVARKTVERLKELLPKQQFTQAIQASASGRIVARETIPAMKKALGDFGKNGGDRTRKMKLWKKQKEGKKRLKEAGRVSVSPQVFKELLKR